MWCWWAIGAAMAGGNDAAELRAQANAEMKLSFDYDALEEQLDAPRAAPETTTARTRLPPLPLVANSSVAEVTVYVDRAVVTRQRSLELVAGDNLVDFVGLPLGIDPATLQASLAGGGDVMSVERLTGQGMALRERDQEAIRTELEPLMAEIGTSRDRIEALLAERAYLRGAVLPQGDNVARPPVAELEKTLAFIGAQETAIAKALREEQDRVSALDRKIHPWIVKLGDPQAEGEKVRVRVHAGQATKSTVALRYQVFGAGWAPAYDARLPSDGGNVDLEYAGVVTQETGEDWTDARLLLSTADASTPGDPPVLSAWYLTSGAGLADVAQEQTVDWKQSSNLPGAPPAAPPAHTVVVFEVPGRWTVRGDGSEQRLPVAALSLAATEDRVAVPRSVPLVYRKVRAVYTGTLPLLAGPVNLFVGTDQVAQASLPATAPGEEIRLYFGGDQRMKVERTLVKRQQELTGLGQRTTRYTFRYRIEVKNLRNEPRDVLVVDQMPVAADDRVSVKALDGTPPLPREPDDAEGIVRWRLTVPAGSAQTIEWGFTVSAPTDAYLPDLMAL